MEPDPQNFLNTLNTLTSNINFGIITEVFVIVLLLFLSALVSGSEVAFFSISPKNRSALKKSNGTTSKRVLSLLLNPKKLLATILITNNFINIAIVIQSSFLIRHTIDFQNNEALAFLVEIILVTFIIVLFGEIIPKVYATKHGLDMAKNMSLPILSLQKTLSPLTYILINTTSFIDKRVSKKNHDISIDELYHILELTSEDTDDKEEQKILKGIVAFGNIDVKQIMTPRIDVEAVEIETPYEDVLNKIVEANFSRVPVYKKSIDNISGVIYTKDLLPHYKKNNNFKWQSLIKAPLIVPESKKIDDLLKDFQEKRIHMAFVVDEYGGTAGIITLEDIIEEIVGELNNEFDRESVVYSKLDDQNYVFEGKTSLVDICRILEIDIKIFEEAQGETDTIAGLILQLNNELPKKNKQIKFRNYTFRVESADNRRIKRVKITMHDNEEELVN